MIDIETINEEFNLAIRKRGAAVLLGKSFASLRMLRWRQKHKNDISLDMKLQILQKSGVQIEKYKYKQEDLVELIKYYQRCSMAARELGAEYIVEKWINRDRDLTGITKL